MPWYWHIGTFLGFFYMGTRAHFCTPNPSARVASSTQSKWPVACQTSPGSLSIGPAPILKLGVLLGHSSLSPATASACGAAPAAIAVAARSTAKVRGTKAQRRRKGKQKQREARRQSRMQTVRDPSKATAKARRQQQQQHGMEQGMGQQPSNAVDPK